MAAETRKSRKSNFSQEEIDVLITTVMQNQNILYGETSKSYFHKEIRNQVWNIILEEVNKVSLERRTLNEVKNKWKKCQYNLRAADHMERTDYGEPDDLDSMPLQQRLSQNHSETSPQTPTQEPVLQSQPISPTKLKVTRQGAKPHQQPQVRAPTPPPPNPEVCLKWNSHHTHMKSAFPHLLMKEQYVDATLVSEGKTLKCHRMILSACSPYFEEVLNGISPFQHPVLFMKDVPFWILKALCDFMYAGEVHILQDKLQEIVNIAETLKIKGLAGSSDVVEDIKPVIPEIKQEIDASPVPKIPERPLKEEREEEPPPTPKLTKHETSKPSKRKEDKKSKHSGVGPKEKEKEMPVEEVPTKVAPKLISKVVIPKVPAKVTVPKVVVPKIHSTPKSTSGKNIVKNVMQKVSKPSTSKTAQSSRKSDGSKKSDKNKVEVGALKEKEKEKEKPPLKKDNINDPLDLLQPVYEEIAKEDPPPIMKCINPVRLKERGNVPVKKGINKKVKKRRYAEYAEEREESPPPVFSSRKGTRSRPHVKFPKFYHTHYEEPQKETTEATIVREPHTDQSDPLIGVEVEEIKAEPVDVEENTIDVVEDNLVNFMQDQEMHTQEDEEIIGNYDSPIVNIKKEIIKRNTPEIFQKMLDPEPVIVNVHTVTEGQGGLRFVDISAISTGHNQLEETIVGSNNFEALEDTQEKTSQIVISNIQSMAELCEENRIKDNAGKPGECEEGPQESKNTTDEHYQQEVSTEPGGRIMATEGLQESSIVFPQSTDCKAMTRVEDLPRTDCDPLDSLSVDPKPTKETSTTEGRLLGNETEIVNTVELAGGSLGSLAAKVEEFCIHSHEKKEGVIASGSLGSLEANVEAMEIESQDLGGEESVQKSEKSIMEREEEILGDHNIERDIRLGENAAVSSICAEEQQLAKSDDLPSLHVEKIQKTVMESDVAIERVVFQVKTQDAIAFKENEVLNRDIEDDNPLEDIDGYREGLSHKEPQQIESGGKSLLPVEAGSQEEESVATDNLEGMSLGSASQNLASVCTASHEMTPGCTASHEITSVCTSSQEMMSIGTASEEMMSVTTGSQEINAEEPDGQRKKQIFIGTTSELLYNTQETQQIESEEILSVSPISKLMLPVEAGSQEKESDGYKQGLIHNTQDPQQIESEEIMSVSTLSKVLLPVETASQEKESVGTDNLEERSLGLASQNSESFCAPSQEMMSVCTSSQEMMSIGTASDEMMSIGTGSQEITAEEPAGPVNKLEASKRNLEDIQEGDRVLSNQKTEQPLEEVMAVQNIENINTTFQKEEYASSYSQYNDTANNEPFAKDTSDVVVPHSGSSDVQERLMENKLLQHEEEIEESCQGETMTVDHENKFLSHEKETVGNKSRVEQSILGAADCRTQSESIAQVDSSGLKENYGAETIETTDNIEAELEECLASTSDIVSIRLCEENFKRSTSRLSFDDDEDFTKDIEFDNCIRRNRPANYLGDSFEEDFNMEEVESDTEYECNEVEDTEVCSDNKKINNEIGYESREDEHRLQSEIEAEYNCDRSEVIGDDRVAISTKIEDVRLVESGNVLCDRVEASKDTSNMDKNAEERIQHTEQAIHTLPPTDADVKGLSPSEEDTSLRAEDQDEIPKTTETFEENRDSTEEDRLLAEDDDIEMENVSEDAAEKTLEMIVNDLNESLGESRK